MKHWLHRITKGHWYQPHIIGYDKYNLYEYDGCDKCREEMK